MKKVNFRAIEIENVAGLNEKVNLAQTLGNALYGCAKTWDICELSRRIWKNGEVDLTEDEVKILNEYIPQIIPSYILRTALLNAIK